MNLAKTPGSRRFATALAVALAAYAAAHLFARAPMMGDDIDYYGFALHRLMPRPEFPPDDGFHFLRWTVWGPILGFMTVFGPGMGAFQFLPFACLAACCALAYAIGARLLGERGGLLAALVLFFHPLMNDLAARPMPDIVEALLATLGLWVLLDAMTSPGRAWRLCGHGALVGLLAFLSWVNRPTGLIWLIAAMMIAAARPRVIAPLFGVALLVCLAGLACEAAVYHGMFGDWFHRWNANLTAAGRKGTEAVPLWWLPLRFLDAVAAGGALKTLLFAVAAGGGVALWRGRETAGRVTAAWTVLLYLGVSCGVQSVFPLRPLVREGERFIGNLAVPLSLCAAAGLLAAGAWALRRWPGLRRVSPGLTWAAAGIVLALGCRRPVRDMAFLPDLRGWLEAAAGAVAANEDAYEAAWIAAPRKASALDWKILRRGDVLKNAALVSPDAIAPARTLLLNRPRFMVTLRKRIESGRAVDLTALPRDLFGPETPWRLSGVTFQPYILDKEARLLDCPRAGLAPEFMRFELPPAGETIRWLPALDGAKAWAWKCDTDAGTLEAGPGGTLVFRRKGTSQARLTSPPIPVPAPWRGAVIQTRILAQSTDAEPFELVVAFTDANGAALPPQVLRQYACAEGFHDFGGIAIPAGAATARLLVAVKSKCRKFDISDVRLSIPDPAGGAPRPAAP